MTKIQLMMKALKKIMDEQKLLHQKIDDVIEAVNVLVEIETNKIK